MAQALPVLARFLRGVKRATGARCAAIFLPVGEPDSADALLALDPADSPEGSEGSDLPELRSIESAWRWHTRINAAEEHDALSSGQASWPAFPSSSDGGFLFPLQLANDVGTVDDETSSRRIEGWLGLQFGSGEESPPGMASWSWLLEIAAGLLTPLRQVRNLLVDPLTGLPSRQIFESSLVQPMEAVRAQGGRLGVALFNPDDFSVVNQTLGRTVGDQVVREIARRLSDALPTSSLRCRFGGVIFAATFLDQEGNSTARRGNDRLEAWARSVLRGLSRDRFVGEDLELRFSCGLTTLSDGADQMLAHPLELLQRADQSLNAAKLLGGNRLVVWSPELESRQTFDRLSGVFTGNTVRDYRNMAFLWNSIAVLSNDLSPEELLDRLLERLAETLTPKSALFVEVEAKEAGEPPRQETFRIRAAVGDATDLLEEERRGGEGEGEGARLSEPARKLVERANKRAVATGSLDRTEQKVAPHRPRLLAARLGAEDMPLGYLLLQANDDAPPWELTDQVFLEAVAPQLALVLRRAEANEREKRDLEEQRQRLEAELESLRSALKRSKLLYTSPRMQRVVETARRAAATDATVLVTGPSGTGKELIARTVHELSERRSKPMVVVDCGAISTTLIESELFGHERGAYTGAQGARKGRLAEADGSTLFLDEIGELPLDVQTKLLRFVQERQYTPVGGSRTRSVDVRVVAATNRDLLAEVKRGRFREDLFYRLNVVRIEVPPLAERVEDIELLATHFLEKFSKQYDRPGLTLSDATRQSLASYTWPGNVRELENRVLQAVILATGSVLQPAHLGLDDHPSRAQQQSESETSTPPSLQPASPSQEALEPVDAAGQASEPPARGLEDHLDHLQDLLGKMVEDCDRLRRRDPLGRWLYDDLVRQAHELGGGTLRGGARLLGIPEATFRRQSSRLREEEEMLGDKLFASRPRGWKELRATLEHILRSAPDPEQRDETLVHQVETRLLREILRRHPRQVSIGAALLGISPPTFRRRVSDLESVDAN